MEELRALIGLKICDGIGDVTANKLIATCGSALAVFNEKRQHLSNIQGVPSHVHHLLQGKIDWARVERELVFINKNQISYVAINDKDYPKNLLKSDRPPLLLFFKGPINKLNLMPCVSIVGTRLATGYGIDAVNELVLALKNSGACVISGLARGIDLAAHQASLNHHIPTFGVVAHGLKTIYPAVHRVHSQKMIDSGGGIITEFLFEEIPNRENFPKRNRIIAGLSFATIVIEAAKRGGALITADLALGYARKVFALPGRYNDKYSEGCNSLIKSGKARPVLSISDLVEELGLQSTKTEKRFSKEVLLSDEEIGFVKIFHNNRKITLDNISAKFDKSISDCSALLFNLEMKGVIRSLPGKAYELC